MGSNGALEKNAGSYKESSPEKYDLRRLPLEFHKNSPNFVPNKVLLVNNYDPIVFAPGAQ